MKSVRPSVRQLIRLSVSQSVVSYLRSDQTDHLPAVEANGVHLLNGHVVSHAKEILGNEHQSIHQQWVSRRGMIYKARAGTSLREQGNGIAVTFRNKEEPQQRSLPSPMIAMRSPNRSA